MEATLAFVFKAFLICHFTKFVAFLVSCYLYHGKKNVAIFKKRKLSSSVSYMINIVYENMGLYNIDMWLILNCKFLFQMLNKGSIVKYWKIIFIDVDMRTK